MTTTATPMYSGSRSLIFRRRSPAVFRRGAPPRLAVFSSLSSLFSPGNVIAAAAAAGGGGSVHGAVTSAITQVAVTAVAIASGACLSTKVDFLWPKVDDQPGSLILDGVDVTGLPIFNEAKVQEAITFAKKAHHGQFRKTGDPYMVHCLHTGKILAALVPTSGKRAVDTIVAGILHDVVDDTCESLDSIERAFGSDVVKLVAGVSRLSFINQLLRRHRRLAEDESTLGNEEANNLRVMLLGMVDDPRVVLIKLADRLHNMRTIYALPSAKAHAVAQETLAVWCSLASRLGLWALKAEMEDLCFAVLQPQVFRQMRADLAALWRPSNRASSFRRISAKSSSLLPSDVIPGAVDESNINIKDLLQAVLPFDVLLDRQKQIKFLYDLEMSSGSEAKPKVVRDAGIALASLVVCEEALEQELLISTSYVPGMEVTLSGRLKSLYSIYSKMKRKDIGIIRVYDARALRVIVGDKNGDLHGEAVQSCYSLLNIVHRLWTPIDGELDDYIVNPKPSGYQVAIPNEFNLITDDAVVDAVFSPILMFRSQTKMAMFELSSLHTAVQGPDNSSLEVQIRTQRMHEYAEYGLAAHWLYKESEKKLLSVGSTDNSEINASSYLSSDLQDDTSIDPDTILKYSSLKVGHPVLRVDGSQLLAATVVRIDKGGKELLVAVSFGLAASEAVANRRSSCQLKRWEVYTRLYKKVSEEWWCEPGHGDWCTCLEKYALCRDGIYHKKDQFGRLLPTFIQIIDLTEREETEYRAVMSAVFEGRDVGSLISNSRCSNSSSSTPGEIGINNKVQLLRTMLQWEEQLRCEAGTPKSVSIGEVVIVCWPLGKIMRLSSGSTAADAARRVGLDGNLVSVNGMLVLPATKLKDGDVVEVRM